MHFLTQMAIHHDTVKKQESHKNLQEHTQIMMWDLSRPAISSCPATAEY